MTAGDGERDGEHSPETALGIELRQRIGRHGPLPLEEFMAACLYDPQHGYYRRSAAIGARADFVTAPEISQTFGELVGLWAAVTWQQMGSPPSLDLIEMGPGRGLMMADLLRATRGVPGFAAAVRVHLVEVSETLAEEQRRLLAGVGRQIRWHRQLAPSLSPGVPAIVLANEVLDALPVAQIVLEAGRWRRREVGLDAAGRLSLLAGPASQPPPGQLAAGDGDVFEWRPDFASLAADLGRHAATGAPLAALFIDYGHAQTGLGDTLQGVRHHRHSDPLAAPGETDLSAQVDFQAFAKAARDAGLAVDGPVTQAEFLGRLGIMERASRLMAANPSAAAAVEAGVARLMAPSGMGSRFKAIGLRGAGIPPTLAGFEGSSDQR